MFEYLLALYAFFLYHEVKFIRENEMITTKDVEHVAKLSRLALSAEDMEKFAPQLNSILEYVNELNEVDTTGVVPMAHSIKISNVMREDEVKQNFTREEMLKNAPEEEDGFFKVPRIN